MSDDQAANSKRLNFVANNDFRIGRDQQNNNQWAVINPRTGATYLGDTLFDAIDTAMSWAAGIREIKSKQAEKGSIIQLN
jgi:hypothetical protein